MGAIIRRGTFKVVKTMTLFFYKLSEDSATHNGNLQSNGGCYFVDQIVIAKELEEKFSGNTLFSLADTRDSQYLSKSGVVIMPDGFGIGKLPASDSFVQCQVILASLSNGDFALFHSSSHLIDKEFKVFYDKIKSNVKHFYFFTRENPTAALKQSITYRTAALYLELAATIGDPKKITHFVVDKYSSIVADSKSNSIFISNSGFEYRSNVDILKMLAEKDSAAILTSITATKSFDQVMNEMASLLQSFPDFIAGDNKYIQKIRKSLANSKSSELKDTIEDKKENEPEKQFKIKVNDIIKKHAEIVRNKKGAFGLFASKSNAKAERILKSLDIANCNFPAIMNAKTFLMYSEGAEPSIEKSLSDAGMLKVVLDEMDSAYKQIFSSSLSHFKFDKK